MVQSDLARTAGSTDTLHRLALPLFVVLVCLSSGCAADEGVDEQGLALCCELGALCHVAGPSVSEDVEECHDLAHANDPDSCRQDYERCLEVCAGVNDDPVEHACR